MVSPAKVPAVVTVPPLSTVKVARLAGVQVAVLVHIPPLAIVKAVRLSVTRVPLFLKVALVSV